MLSGSAMVRVVVLLVSAALLAGLFQFLWPRAPQEASEQMQPGTPSSEAQGPREPVRTIPTAKPPVEASKPPPEAASPAPERVEPPKAAQAPPAAPPTAPPLAATPPSPPVASPAPPVVADPGERALDDAGPRAVALVDLNTATLAQLNALKGGGNIGRAIIQRRPYTAVDQLLSKRVLSRATYDKIKDQVTVQ